MPIHQLDTAAARGDIEFDEYGSGATRVLILHAAATGPAAYTTLATALAAARLRVIVPALHGYARTRLHGPETPLQAHLAVGRAMLDRFGHEPLHVFGHSMGGLLALELACEPVGIASLTVFEPILIGLLDANEADQRRARERDRAVVAALGQAVAQGHPEAGVAQFIEAWNEVPWRHLPVLARSQLVASAELLASESLAVSAHDYGARQAAQIQRALGSRLLALRGDRSPRVTAMMNERLAALVPGASLATLAGCGHMGPVLNGKRVAEPLAAFVAHHADTSGQSMTQAPQN